MAEFAAINCWCWLVGQCVEHLPAGLDHPRLSSYLRVDAPVHALVSRFVGPLLPGHRDALRLVRACEQVTRSDYAPSPDDRRDTGIVVVGVTDDGQQSCAEIRRTGATISARQLDHCQVHQSGVVLSCMCDIQRTDFVTEPPNVLVCVCVCACIYIYIYYIYCNMHRVRVHARV